MAIAVIWSVFLPFSPLLKAILPLSVQNDIWERKFSDNASVKGCLQKTVPVVFATAQVE